MPAYQTSNHAYQGQGQFVYQTAQVGPAPSAPTGGGRWYGYYPTYEEKRELKQEIVKVIREKKEIERKLSFSPNRQDLTKLVERLNELQLRLNRLMVDYVQLLESWREYRNLQDEEEEFLLFMSSNL